MASREGSLEAPTPLTVDTLATDGEAGYREQVLSLTPAATLALQRLAKAHTTTLNTLVQWAWGYVLHRYSGEAQVVFGATISGRTAPVAGIEEMVGLFINTIPVRVRYDLAPVASIAALHAELQSKRAAVMQMHNQHEQARQALKVAGKDVEEAKRVRRGCTHGSSHGSSSAIAAAPVKMSHRPWRSPDSRSERSGASRPCPR